MLPSPAPSPAKRAEAVLSDAQLDAWYDSIMSPATSEKTVQADLDNLKEHVKTNPAAMTALGLIYAKGRAHPPLIRTNPYESCRLLDRGQRHGNAWHVTESRTQLRQMVNELIQQAESGDQSATAWLCINYMHPGIKKALPRHINYQWLSRQAQNGFPQAYWTMAHKHNKIKLFGHPVNTVSYYEIAFIQSISNDWLNLNTVITQITSLIKNDSPITQLCSKISLIALAHHPKFPAELKATKEQAQKLFTALQTDKSSANLINSISALEKWAEEKALPDAQTIYTSLLTAHRQEQRKKPASGLVVEVLIQRYMVKQHINHGDCAKHILTALIMLAKDDPGVAAIVAQRGKNAIDANEPIATSCLEILMALAVENREKPRLVLDSLLPTDLQARLQWYRSRAWMGSPYAMALLADTYYFGTHGHERNLDQAALWYRKAFEANGSPHCLTQLRYIAAQKTNPQAADIAQLTFYSSRLAEYKSENVSTVTWQHIIRATEYLSKPDYLQYLYHCQKATESGDNTFAELCLANAHLKFYDSEVNIPAILACCVKAQAIALTTRDDYILYSNFTILKKLTSFFKNSEHFPAILKALNECQEQINLLVPPLFVSPLPIDEIKSTEATKTPGAPPHAEVKSDVDVRLPDEWEWKEDFTEKLLLQWLKPLASKPGIHNKKLFVLYSATANHRNLPALLQCADMCRNGSYNNSHLCNTTKSFKYYCQALELALKAKQELAKIPTATATTIKQLDDVILAAMEGIALIGILKPKAAADVLAKILARKYVPLYNATTNKLPAWCVRALQYLPPTTPFIIHLLCELINAKIYVSQIDNVIETIACNINNPTVKALEALTTLAKAGSLLAHEKLAQHYAKPFLIKGVISASDLNLDLAIQHYAAILLLAKNEILVGNNNFQKKYSNNIIQAIEILQKIAKAVPSKADDIYNLLVTHYSTVVTVSNLTALTKLAYPASSEEKKATPTTVPFPSATIAVHAQAKLSELKLSDNKTVANRAWAVVKTRKELVELQDYDQQEEKLTSTIAEWRKQNHLLRSCKNFDTRTARIAIRDKFFNYLTTIAADTKLHSIIRQQALAAIEGIQAGKCAPHDYKSHIEGSITERIKLVATKITFTNCVDELWSDPRTAKPIALFYAFLAVFTGSQNYAEAQKIINAAAAKDQPHQHYAIFFQRLIYKIHMETESLAEARSDLRQFILRNADLMGTSFSVTFQREILLLVLPITRVSPSADPRLHAPPDHLSATRTTVTTPTIVTAIPSSNAVTIEMNSLSPAP